MLSLKCGLYMALLLNYLSMSCSTLVPWLLEIRTSKEVTDLLHEKSDEKTKMTDKMNPIIYIALGALLIYMIGGKGGVTSTTTVVPTSGSNNIDLSTVVQPSVSFTGQRMFLEGTALTSDYVRVIKEGSRKDLGQKSMNSGTLSTEPNAKYMLYWGENGSTYYTLPESYTAKAQESQDDKVGVLCSIDTNPTVTIFDEYSRVQDGSSYNQSIASDETKEMSIKVKVASDKCFGAPTSAKSNAICFRYNSTKFLSVEANSGSQEMPYSVASGYAASGKAIACYKLNKLQDLGSQEIAVTLKSASVAAIASAHEIQIYLDDVDFDLNADDLSEIDGFQDEDNNALGSAIVTGDSIGIATG